MSRYVHSFYPVPENLRNRNVSYGKEIIGDNSCQDDNIVSEKESLLVFDYGETKGLWQMMYTSDQRNKMENGGMFPTYQQVNGNLLQMNFTHLLKI